MQSPALTHCSCLMERLDEVSQYDIRTMLYVSRCNSLVYITESLLTTYTSPLSFHIFSFHVKFWSPPETIESSSFWHRVQALFNTRGHFSYLYILVWNFSHGHGSRLTKECMLCVSWLISWLRFWASPRLIKVQIPSSAPIVACRSKVGYS